MSRRVASILVVCSLSFGLGAFATAHTYFPFDWINRSFEAVKAIKAQRQNEQLAIYSDGLMRPNAKTLEISTPKSYGGYTLYTPSRSKAILLDEQGREAHKWSIDYTGKGKPPLNWRDVHALPGGDLLVLEEQVNVTPYGHAIKRLNAMSATVWENEGKFHHLIYPAKDGRIVALSHQFTDRREFPEIALYSPSYIEDFIVVLDENGKELQRASLLKMLVEAGFAEQLSATYKDKPDWKWEIDWKWDLTHTNSVMMLEKDMAKAFPMFKAGQILVSVRNMSLLLVVDMEEKRIVWSARGGWRIQHDAKFLPDGSILIFDNAGVMPRSRILRYKPATDSTETVYGDLPDERFYSAAWGASSFLPNGNLFIVSSMAGDLLEVSPEGEKVWLYHSPYYVPGTQKRAVIFAAKRYGRGYFSFLE